MMNGESRSAGGAVCWLDLDLDGFGVESGGCCGFLFSFLNIYTYIKKYFTQKRKKTKENWGWNHGFFNMGIKGSLTI